MNKLVMLLSNSFKPDPRVLKEATFLQHNGFNVTIVCWDRMAELPAVEVLPSGVKIIRIQTIPSNYGIGIRQIFRLPRFWLAVQHHLTKLNPQFIHCHDFDTLPAGILFGKLHRIPVIYDAHEYYAELVKPRLNGIVGRILFYLIKWAELFGAQQSQAVVTVDETLGATYRKSNLNVIILGHYPERRMATERNQIFTRSNLTLIYSGRLSVDRGLFVYVNLVRKLQEQGIPARLLLAGVFTPESERDKFNIYAKSLINSIDILGWIPYELMPKFYHEADIGLAVLLPEPRYVAATPVKLFEYMANGLVVIASNFPAIEQIVKDANCGLLIEPLADLTGPIEIIAQWWENKDFPRALGENGRQVILNNYNWENQINRLVKLYKELS